MSIFSWSISEKDLKEQVENYHSLSISESSRGKTVLVFSGLFVLVAGVSFFAGSLEDTLWSLVVYIPLLVFVHRGSRWAVILLIITWTLDQGYALYSGGGYMIIVWWLIITPVFYHALQVENARKKDLVHKNINSIKNEVANNVQPKFCRNCGKELNGGAKFCVNCGAKM